MRLSALCQCSWKAASPILPASRANSVAPFKWSISRRSFIRAMEPGPACVRASPGHDAAPTENTAMPASPQLSPATASQSAALPPHHLDTTTQGAPSSGRSRLPSILPDKVLEFLLGVVAFLQDLWRSVMRALPPNLLGTSMPMSSLRLRLAPAPDTAVASSQASPTPDATSTTPDCTAALTSAAPDAATTSHRPAPSRPRPSLGASSSTPSLHQPTLLVPHAATAHGSPASTPRHRRNVSFDLSEHQLNLINDAVVPVKLKQMGARAQEVLAQVHHAFHDTPDAAAELAGEMMGRGNYHHPRPRPGRSLSVPVSPRGPSASGRQSGTGAPSPGWKNWSQYLVSRFTGDGSTQQRRPDVSLQALMDPSFWGPAATNWLPGRPASTTAVWPRPVTPPATDASAAVGADDTETGAGASGDAAGQATMSVGAGPLGSEAIAESLRTVGHTLMHPQAAAAEVAGRMLGKSSGHDM